MLNEPDPVTPRRAALSNDVDIKLIQNLTPIFIKVQSYPYSKLKKSYRKPSDVKNHFRSVLNEYIQAIHTQSNDLQPPKKTPRYSPDISFTEERIDEVNRLNTIEQMLSLANVLFFQLGSPKLNPGVVLSYWLKDTYNDTIMSILSETIISGDSTDIYQVFYILLVAGKIDDARKFFQVIVKKFAEQQNSLNLKKICSKFQKLDQILIQLNVILSDPNSFRQRMEQFQNNIVAPLYEKMK